MIKEEYYEINDENIYILGFPFGFTEQLYYQVVNGINKGTFKGIKQGEFFNFSNVDYAVNRTHHDLMKKKEKMNGRYFYSSDNYKKLKQRLLKQLDLLTAETVVVRDTVEPELFRYYLSTVGGERQAIFLDVEPEFVVDKMVSNDVYFPTNLVGYKEDRETLLEAVTKARKGYTRLQKEVEGVRHLDVLDFLETPLKPLRMARDMGFEVKDDRFKNHLGRKIMKWKNSYKDVIKC